MIPYEELDKALARWKSRTQNAAAEAAREFEASGAVPAATSSGTSGGMPTPPPDRTGEIELGDAESIVESYEEA
jgi:hypothetical protein